MTDGIRGVPRWSAEVKCRPSGQSDSKRIGLPFLNREGEEEYEKDFGDFIHPFTGINMIHFYRELIEEQGCEAHFILANKATEILKYTNNVIACDIHTRYKTKKSLEENGAKCFGLFEIDPATSPLLSKIASQVPIPSGNERVYLVLTL